LIFKKDVTTMLQLTLPVRRLVEFLLMSGSIDNRFTGFDRANEGARLHRKLQREARSEHPDYAAEVALRQEYTVEGIQYTIEGRADGIFTAPDGVMTIDEIKTTALPSEAITGQQSPEHWAQGQVYAAVYSLQKNLSTVRVQLTYYQVDEEKIFRFSQEYTAAELADIVTKLLTQYAPWAKRAADDKTACRAVLARLPFPFPAYRPGQKAMVREVYEVCQKGGQLLCQAPTGIGKTMSVLFPALKAAANGVDGPVFYLTARGTTRAAAENALHLLRQGTPAFPMRSVTLTAKDKICLCERRECTPEGCPYANGYYDRIKPALWDTLGAFNLTAEVLCQYARKHTVCPFELGLDASLWCDVIVGDYNYLFDPVVQLQRFFTTHGEYLFLIDEAHNLPGRAREMHSAVLRKSDFHAARKLLGKPKSRLKTALNRVNDRLIVWRHRCEEEKCVFSKQRDEEFDLALTRLCEPLQDWLDEHREPDDTHTALLQLYFDVRGWLRVADTFDDHFVLQAVAYGSEVTLSQLCLDASNFLSADFAKGRAAVLFSATLGPAGYYKDLCGIPEAKAVALRSPFPTQNLGLWCARRVSTRYKDREQSLSSIAAYLAAMSGGRPGNYLAFFPSHAYLQQVFDVFTQTFPEITALKQDSAMDEKARADFLAHFDAPPAAGSLLGFAVMGGVFGEGVDLDGDRLSGAAIVGPGLPQISPRQEQLRDYFEESRGSGFDYAYRYPGMNKVLQAAGRVIRTPQDRGVVLLIDERFSMSDYRRLFPPHWSHLRMVDDVKDFSWELAAFWNNR